VEIVDSIHAYALVADNPEFETADLDAIVDAACFTLQGPIDRNAAVITRDHLPSVRGDGAKLLLLFQELFRNALKFRGEAPPRIHCSSFRCLSSGNQEPSIIFSVADNGVGIPTKQLDAVFKPLKRLEGEGAGMGLAICRRIVDMHGGKIWVESESMGGADFRFSLPT
jgi:signal transduction histidine kinase